MTALSPTATTRLDDAATATSQLAVFRLVVVKLTPSSEYPTVPLAPVMMIRFTKNVTPSRSFVVPLFWGTQPRKSVPV